MSLSHLLGECDIVSLANGHSFVAARSPLDRQVNMLDWEIVIKAHLYIKLPVVVDYAVKILFCQGLECPGRGHRLDLVL